MADYLLERKPYPNSGRLTISRSFADEDEAIKSFDFWREQEGTKTVRLTNLETGLIVRNYRR